MGTFKILTVLWVALLLNLPFAAAAATQHEHGSHGQETAVPSPAPDQTGQHHGPAQDDAGAADGQMFIVGSQVSKGIRGMAHLNDVAALMGRFGMATTHHFMIAFVDEVSGEQIDRGTVAMKITNPDAKLSETIELTGMDGHFGADIVLDMAGEYHFRLDTKLADGVSRKYHFHFVNR